MLVSERGHSKRNRKIQDMSKCVDVEPRKIKHNKDMVRI